MSNLKKTTFHPALLILAAFLGLWAFWGSRLIFPYLSNNHDEAVYLYQAKTLLSGHLTQKIGELGSFFKVWFQKEYSGHYVFKYTPVHASFLALGERILGDPIFSIAAIAIALVLSAYFFFGELYRERSRTLIATLILSLSPMSLMYSMTYLSYCSNLVLLLLFSFFLIRGAERRLPLLQWLAGAFFGLCFFSRPFDALLFGAPFLILSVRRNSRICSRLILGSLPLMVGVALFNRKVTGNPLHFPFQIDTSDQFGFGDHRITADAPWVHFTLESALDSAWQVLVDLPMWCLGSVFLFHLHKIEWSRFKSWPHRALYLTIATYFTGNLFFWGTYNSLKWGGFHYLGPFYFYPTLVALSFLITNGIVFAYQNFKRRTFLGEVALSFLLFAFLMGLILKTNLKFTEKFEKMYAPLSSLPPDHALLFVEPIIGKNLLHPYARLMNSPDLKGPVLYAVDQGAKDLELVRAFPDREPYRLRLFGTYDETTSTQFEVQVIPLHSGVCKNCVFKIAFENPTPNSFVYFNTRYDSHQDGWLIDRNSAPGKQYSMTVTAESDRVIVEDSFSKRRTVYIDSWKDLSQIQFFIHFFPLLDQEAYASSPYLQYILEITPQADGSMAYLKPLESRFCLARSSCESHSFAFEPLTEPYRYEFVGH